MRAAVKLMLVLVLCLTAAAVVWVAPLVVTLALYSLAAVL